MLVLLVKGARIYKSGVDLFARRGKVPFREDADLSIFQGGVCTNRSKSLCHFFLLQLGFVLVFLFTIQVVFEKKWRQIMVGSSEMCIGIGVLFYEWDEA